MARQRVARLIGAASPTRSSSTSGGTEANNTAILSMLATRPDHREIVTSTVEHPATLVLCDQLEKTRGYIVHRIGVDAEGRLDEQAYRKALSPRTALATIMWANNETARSFPCPGWPNRPRGGRPVPRRRGPGAGKLPIEVKSTPIDLLSISRPQVPRPQRRRGVVRSKGIEFRGMILGGRQDGAGGPEPKMSRASLDSARPPSLPWTGSTSRPARPPAARPARSGHCRVVPAVPGIGRSGGADTQHAVRCD